MIRIVESVLKIWFNKIIRGYQEIKDEAKRETPLLKIKRKLEYSYWEKQIDYDA